MFRVNHESKNLIPDENHYRFLMRRINTSRESITMTCKIERLKDIQQSLTDSLPLVSLSQSKTDLFYQIYSGTLCYCI